MGQPANEAVFFMKDHQVSRQMLFTEFEALLDGLSSIPEYEDEDAYAVYTVISRYGEIEAAVFFKIYFDEESHADTSWNLPVEKLASISGRGPDLGGGPIRLACRSQCSINWHLDDLWDPDMTPGSNDFLALRKAVAANRLRLKFSSKPEPAAPPVVPVLNTQSSEPPTLQSVEPPTLSQKSSGIPELGNDMDPEKRMKLARLIKEQRLRIRTLETYKERAAEEMDREQRIILHAYKQEIQNLKQNIEQLKLANEKLQEKLSDRNEQYISLQDKVSTQTQVVDDLKEQLKSASSEERDELEKRKMEAEIVLLREQLDRKDLDLAYRDEREDMLRAELDELKETMSEGGDSEGIIDKLRDMEVVYVAYHPGVGHVSMMSNEIREYADNPLAFVANKAGVSESLYKAWLEHFENPICLQEDGSGGKCERRVDKVDVPSDFELGISDRCDLHKLDA